MCGISKEFVAFNENNFIPVHGHLRLSQNLIEF
jgi:hypothetical protein